MDTINSPEKTYRKTEQNDGKDGFYQGKDQIGLDRALFGMVYIVSSLSIKDTGA